MFTPFVFNNKIEEIRQHTDQIIFLCISSLTCEQFQPRDNFCEMTKIKTSWSKCHHNDKYNLNYIRFLCTIISSSAAHQN